MSVEEEETEYLFSYGTLQDEAVQVAIFGRRLAGNPCVLVGYSLKVIQVKDENFVALSGSEHQRTLRYTGAASDQVEGAVLRLTKRELAQADAYEPAGYERQLVRLKSGLSAWVYVNISQ
ncbi:MAG TPA: gamma-glutamylcyclotransferase family protein [Pyrinomonadaceae bacterium]|jgi:gamma-glutamylcyclotransferase (GGCT)/AIG2-like uncharacterized protein YtfP